MCIFAISDLHLSMGGEKPMDKFGPAWENHPEVIRRNWDSQVSQDDLVLIGGDTSWAMRQEDTLLDLQYVADRPGRKLLIRGNHDYWWKREATRKLQRMIDPSITLLQGQSLVFDNVGITGTRGWAKEGAEGLDAQQSVRVFDRELRYLENGLTGLPDGLELKIVLLHFPPFGPDLQLNEFFCLAKQHGVDIVIYGHLHKPASENRLEGEIEGIQLHLVAVDHIGFGPKLLRR